MPTALGYLRVSSEKQAADDRDGLRRQEEAVRRFAQARGFALIEPLICDAVSGTYGVSEFEELAELRTRRGIRELVRRIETDRPQAVIVERADRLARSNIVGQYLIQQLKTQGISLYVVDSGRDLTACEGPYDSFLARLMLLIAELDKDILVLRMKAGRDRKSRELGRRCEGRKPQPLPTPVEDYLRMYYGRRSVRAIQRDLERRGLGRYSWGRLDRAGKRLRAAAKLLDVRTGA